MKDKGVAENNTAEHKDEVKLGGVINVDTYIGKLKEYLQQSRRRA